jgi:tRNA threonylcarbamoyladenosine biosynthesis protein TsaE
VVIEWPERLGHGLPRDRLDIELEIVGEAPAESRIARLTPHGAWEGRPLEF